MNPESIIINGHEYTTVKNLAESLNFLTHHNPMKKDSVVLKYKSGITLFDNSRYITICDKIYDELKLRADEIGLIEQGQDKDGNEYVIIRVTFKD